MTAIDDSGDIFVRSPAQGGGEATKRQTRTAVCVSGQIRSLHLQPSDANWPKVGVLLSLDLNQ